MYKSVDEINAIELKDVILEILSSMLDLSSVPLGVHFYEYSADDTLHFYDRIILHESLAKPSLEAVEAEFVIYKQKLLDEFEPKKVAKERLDALSNLRALAVRTGNNQPNMKLFYKQIIEDSPNGTAILDALEAEDAIYKVEKIKKDQIEEEMKLGAKAKEAGDACLHVVRGHNHKLNLSHAQVMQMKIEFGDIFQSLSDGMPETARALIENVTNQNYLELKDKLLAVLSDRGF